MKIASDEINGQRIERTADSWKEGHAKPGDHFPGMNCKIKQNLYQIGLKE